MTTRRLFPVLAVAASALVACAQPGSSSPSSYGSAASAETTDTVIVLAPSAATPAALQSGCWATFYDERNFRGDSLTLVGPVDLQTLDKGSARQLKRAIDSIVTGPNANLVVYERQLFSNRSVGFSPGSREASLTEKLGFGGRIESMRLRCNG